MVTDPRREISKMIVSDEDFNKLLVQEANAVKNIIEAKPTDGWHAMLNIYTKHGVKGEYEAIAMLLVGFPPPPGSLVSRYDLMKGIGAKYYDEAVKKQPAGKKNYPFAAFLSSEAWINDHDNEEIKKQRKEQGFTDLSKIKGSQEYVVTMGMTMDYRVNCSSAKILRDKKNNIFLGEAKVSKYDDKRDMYSDMLICFFQGFGAALNNDKSN